MRGYFGIGIYHPKTSENIGTLWRSAFIFGASFIFTIGKRYKKQASDTTVTEKQIPLLEYISIKDFNNHRPKGAQLICIELDEKARPLNTFNHPKQAVYLLGAEDYGIPKELLKKNINIQIPCYKPYPLNVSTAGSIVLADRYFKNL